MCAGVRIIRGRFVVLHNPTGRFDLLGPVTGVSGGQNDVKSDSSFSEVRMNEVISGDAVRDVQENKRKEEKERKRGREEEEEDITTSNVDLSYRHSRHDERMADQNIDVKTTTTSSSPVSCEVVSSVGTYDKLTGTFFGNVVSRGNILQESSSHNVHFGVRNGTFFTGYLDPSIPLITQSKNDKNSDSHEIEYENDENKK